MAKTNTNLLTAIDLGSAKVCALVAEITESGLRYRGHGITETLGTRRGLVVDLDKAVKSIQRAVEKAENAAGAPIDRAVVGIAGPQIRGVKAEAAITLGLRAREITRDDIRQLYDKARAALVLPDDYEPLHWLVREYLIDDQGGVQEPLGFVGRTLAVRLCVVTTTVGARQNVVTALNLAGVQVDSIVLEPLASADFLLRADERELGVCLADIGAGSTDLIVYEEGAVEHVGVVPIGGDHFTKDLAVLLPTPVADAEKLKRMYGNAIVISVSDANEVEVPAVAERPPRMEKQRRLSEILEARAEQLCELMRNHLRDAGVLDKCRAGFVLTGGGARLGGMSEIVERILRDSNGHVPPVRIASAPPIARMPVELADPEFSASVGLVLYAYRTRMARVSQDNGFAARLKALFAGRGN